MGSVLTIVVICTIIFISQLTTHSISLSNLASLFDEKCTGLKYTKDQRANSKLYNQHQKQRMKIINKNDKKNIANIKHRKFSQRIHKLDKAQSKINNQSKQKYPDQKYPDQKYPDQKYPDQKCPNRKYLKQFHL